MVLERAEIFSLWHLIFSRQISDTHLQVHLWVPVAVIQDDDVCCVEVDAQATCPGGQEEDKFLAPFPVVVINLGFSVFSRCVT